MTVIQSMPKGRNTIKNGCLRPGVFLTWERAHDEHPMSPEQIDSILDEFIADDDDEYLSQQATVVFRFLKILSKHPNEPLIVNLK
jgi:hypothetical protein